MARKAAKYREEAQKAFAKGKWEKALSAYGALAKLEPNEPKNHQKVAELMAKMNQKKAAIERYKTALDLYMKKGFLIQAIALCKIVIQMDPGEKEMEDKLADLYSRRGIPEGPGAPGKPPVTRRPPADTPRPTAAESSQRPQPAAPPRRQAAPQLQQPAEEEPKDEGITLEEGGDEEMAVERTSYESEETAPEPEETSPDSEEDMPEMFMDEGYSSEEASVSQGTFDSGEGIELEDTGEGDMELDTTYGQEVSAEAPEESVEEEQASAPDMEEEPVEEQAQESEKVWDISEGMEEEGEGVEIDIDKAESEEEEEEEKEAPVYDLSAEMETGAEFSSLEEGWDEEEEPAEQEAASPPSGTGLLDESDLEDATFFPEIPLFSDLDADQFKEVVRKLQSRSYNKHDEVLKEGDPGDSILIVASGRLEVYKETEQKGRVFLASLRDGDFFGEFGYFAGRKRQASVVAAEDTEVLEITRKDVEEVVTKFPGVEKVLEDFYRTRVIENLLATSPLFTELDAGQRSYIASLFKLEGFKEQEDVVKEGEEGEKMYLIRMGHVLVHTQNPMGEQVRLAELGPGDFFGEISLLLNKPRTATVTTASPVVELMSLHKEDLDAIVSDYPAIGEKLQQVMEQRTDDTVNKVSFLELDEDNLEIGSLL